MSPPAPTPIRVALVVLIGSVLACAGSGPEASAQGLERCEPVHRFLVGEMGMVAEIDPDTVDDWRTRKTLPGCRVTAAGSTSRAMGPEAGTVYERLMSAGWTRTPDPRDAPNESALRLRLGETDCFFNIYSGVMVGSETELRVTMDYVPPAGESRYNVLVQCVEAMEAAPRP